ncbi:hypothetical protein GCM10010988_40180 [Cnuibacter physcomitrellae]|uniref:Uncharacterized protein n=1 Tax=Cnuibacter physcomitrellae TaxID=1619308 RepID=A0A1X9LTC7_9MICO|nr:helix-turn-helix domain-containing protein [Cnuibacter physcomitrellae]ARJ07662.1 hypothetical protein B5808_20000 [Cnuibacter physcomitrellae]GGI42666.1 hypothetical protein GCM10010988_40180 [Cnuibacter physcomitrellae]
MSDNSSEDLLAAAGQMLGNQARNEVLRVLVRRGEVSVPTIAKETHIRADTVTRHINELEDLGVAKIDLPRGSRHGRRFTVRLDRERYKALFNAWVGAMDSES